MHLLEFPDASPQSQEHLDLSRVPPMYYPYQEVFSKRRATTLSPHRPYDCAIDLIPGTIPPRGRIFHYPLQSGQLWMAK